MLVTDLAKPLQIPLRNQNTGGTGNRLDNHRGDGRRIMKRRDALQLVGQFGTVIRLTAGKRIAGRSCVCGM